MHLIHRDIKPENILMNKGTPIIADLGISRFVSSSGAKTRIGTLEYLAPEVLKNE